MFLEFQKTELEADVWDCLEQVTDPELDEPVTDMGFVERIAVFPDRKRVEVDFRLPTYWCSPNFAFLMAFDIRIAVGRMPWVEQVQVTLNDHCFADKVNAGVNSDRPFSEVFAAYCDGDDLHAVRMKFLEKAFVRRQETLLLALEAWGYSAQDIVDMTLGTLDGIAFQGEEERKQKPRYRALLLAQGLAGLPADPAFVTWDGARLTTAGLRDYLAKLRGVRINMEFNGALCRGLQSTRYKEVRIGADGPTLIDFIQNRVPPRQDRATR
ncbi:metal-sulfur cluster assembly factor [Puniceibacterium confluentis]|uniref:metal-sulfur cluster assembly factor n=1 Tax=Puniceibacterium confluentis TaxID=1958944 RepID=UPI0011B7CE36|nr:iron-sulfur cluster assembly protein [Puniceibacterium confluentis]